MHTFSFAVLGLPQDKLLHAIWQQFDRNSTKSPSIRYSSSI